MNDYVKSLNDEQVDNAIQIIEKLKLAGKNLSPEQVRYAVEIANKASNMGIPPELAVSMAYHESGLDPSKTGSIGEIGIMQVRPSTAADMGFDSKELKKNPDQQIDAGLRYLKEQLVNTNNDPVMAVVAYNAGPDSQFFKIGKLHPKTEKYLDHVKSMGGFDGAPLEPIAPSEPTAQVEETAPEAPLIDLSSLPQEKTGEDLNELERRLKKNLNDQEVRQAQIYGGITGGVLGGKRFLGEKLSNFAKNATQQVIEGVLAGQQAASGNAPASLGGQPAISGPAISGGQPTGGKMAFNWGKAGGLGDIEAGRATAMGKTPGSADELIKARADALKRLQTMAPATGMVEDPTRGAIMVPEQTPYTGPRGPQGEIGGAKPPLVSPVTPKPLSALEEVTSLFHRFTNTPLMRYLGPAAGGALAAGDAVRVAQELRKPKPDYGEIGLSGTSSLGGLLSLSPRGAVAGIPLIVGSQIARLARDRARENADQDVRKTWNPNSLRYESKVYGPSFSEPSGYEQKVIPSNPMGDFGF
jgi:hypothetical protein